MARQIQTPDPLTINGAIVFGTALHRLDEIVEDQPQDQECAGFYAGDVRDVCATVSDSKDEIVGKLAEQVRGKAPGAECSLPVADVRKLIAVARKPKPAGK